MLMKQDSNSQISIVLMICAGLIIGVFVVFSQVRNHEFISFDDGSYIFENEHIRTGLKVENIVYFFKNNQVGNYHPLTSISHMLDVEIYGLNPMGHHLNNVLLHALNAAGLFFVLFYMTGRIWPSAFVAAVFAFHPLRVESVAWASERKDVLSTFFWLLTLTAYVYYVRIKDVSGYMLVIMFYILAALSKPMVVTLPCLMFLLDYWPLGRYAVPEGEQSRSRYVYRRAGKLLLEKIPLFAISVMESIVTLFIFRTTDLMKSAAEFPFEWRIWNVFYAYAIYIGRLIWPANLSIFYPYPGQSLVWWQVAGSIVLIISVSFIAIWQWKKRPYIGVGWFWFVGMFIPVIGLIQIGLQGTTDRWTYMPLTGVVIIIAWCAAELIKTRRAKAAAAILSVLIVVGFAAAQYRQTGYWRNNETLYTHAVNAVDGNWWAYNFLGREFARQGRYQEAVNCFLKSLQISGDNLDTKCQLGKALLSQGKPDEAVLIFESFLPKIPIDAQQADLGNEIGKMSQLGAIWNVYIESHLNCAEAFFRKGDYDKAIKHYKEVLRVSPGMTAAYTALGEIYAERGDLQEAANQYSQMLRQNPEAMIILSDVCLKLAEQGKSAQSEVILRKIIENIPGNADLHNNLGIALGQQAKFADAVQEFEKALAMNPASSDVESNLGFALACQGNLQQAIKHLERAVYLNPGNETARTNLERAKEHLKGQGHH